jgi:hypothetical protein
MAVWYLSAKEGLMRLIFAFVFWCLCGSAWAQNYPTPQFNQAPLSGLNLSLSSSVTSHELTVAILDPNGNALSASKPVIIDYPSPTTGGNVFRPITSATAITTGAISDSFGCLTGVLCKLWIWAIDNSGTEGICIYNTLSGTSIIDLNEAIAQSSASGTSGGTSTQTLYCNISSVSSKSVRRLGYIEATWTSGTGWSAPSTVILFGPSIKKPNDVLVTTPISSTTTQSSTNTTSFASFGPTQSITLQDATDLVNISVLGNMAVTTSAATWNVSLGRGATAIGPSMLIVDPASSVLGFPFSLELLDAPQTASSVTYGMLGKTSSGGSTVYFPYTNGGSNVGGAQIQLQEIVP